MRIIAIILVICFAIALPRASRAQNPAPAGAPVPDALAELKQRQRVCDEAATVRVVIAERQAAYLLGVNPRKARQLLQTTLKDLATDPDLSGFCRSKLQEKLKRDLQRWFAGRRE